MHNLYEFGQKYPTKSSLKIENFHKFFWSSYNISAKIVNKSFYTGSEHFQFFDSF